MLEGALDRGYEELFVLTPTQLAAVILGGVGPEFGGIGSTLGPGDRLALLVERIDELSLQRHDFGGNANALLGGFVRRIDRLKAELIGAEDYARWASYLEAGGRRPVRGARSPPSSPRCTGPTSGSWPKPASATRAT